jgi:HK97 gp10 family phage protein
MDEIEFKITGLKELQEKLERLPPKAAKDALRTGLAAGIFLWQQEMEWRVRKHTGFLSFHIIARIIIRGSELMGIASVGPERIDYPDRGGGYRKKKIKGRLRDVGRIPASRVASFLEFGTRKMQKKPFIRESFEARKMEVLDEFIIETKAALARAGLKLS